MTLFSKLLAVVCLLSFLTAFLFLIFGQVTVRKLRKKPETKNLLGVEYLSGWDIINVAQALSLPRSWTRKLEVSAISPVYAQSSVLYQHTTRLDRILAATFYWLLIGTGFLGVLLLIFNYFGLLGE